MCVCVVYVCVPCVKCARVCSIDVVSSALNASDQQKENEGNLFSRSRSVYPWLRLAAGATGHVHQLRFALLLRPFS